LNPVYRMVCFDHAARLGFSVANFGAILTFNCAVNILLVVAFIAVCMFECVLVSLEVFANGYHTKQKRIVCFNRAPYHI